MVLPSRVLEAFDGLVEPTERDYERVPPPPSPEARPPKAPVPPRDREVE